MFRRALLFLSLMWGQDIVWSVRIVEFRVPAHSREGGRALLGCQFELDGENLYSVKWYKGKEEFYRYVPKNTPSIRIFKRPGVNVNKTGSSTTVVVLENLSRESEGDYSCEVSGESPKFQTAKSVKHITIHLLPESGPHMTGAKEQYSLDEEAVINCTSTASRPVAELQWLVNDEPASPSDVRGPWHRVSDERPDAVETTLQLRFIVEPRHFVNSAMRIKCQATIPPMYQRETNSTHYIALPFTFVPDQTTFQVSAVTDRASDFKQLQGAIYLLGALFLIVRNILPL